MSDSDDEFLTIDEAAERLKVDTATVQRELRAQRLPGNKVGRAWRIRFGDLKGYLRSQRRDPRQAIEYAHLCLRGEAFDNALVTLVGALGYEDMPTELRFALTRRISQLIEAREMEDVARARDQVAKTRWDPDGDEAFAITYFSTISPPWRVSLPKLWNKMIDEFDFALRASRRRREAIEDGL